MKNLQNAQAIILNLTNSRIEESYDLRYILSLSLAYQVNPSYLLRFLQVLYVIYPYKNSLGDYRSFYDENTPTNDVDLIQWINILFMKLYGIIPLSFPSLPTPKEWGPIYWRFLFSLDESDTVASFANDILPFILPCNECRDHLISYLKDHSVSFPVHSWLGDLRLAISSLGNPPLPQLNHLSTILNRGNKKHFSSSPSIVLPPGYIPQKRICKGCGGG